MLTPDYSKCLKRSIIYSQRLQRIGFNPTIRYGTFTPETPRNLWDDRWQAVEYEAPEFSHVWLELGIFIIDISCAQFGEPSPHLAIKNDHRYYGVGTIDQETLGLIPDPTADRPIVCEYANGIFLCRIYV